MRCFIRATELPCAQVPSKRRPDRSYCARSRMKEFPMQQPAHQEDPAKYESTAELRSNAAPRDLRSTLDWLQAQGDLIETDKEVDPDLEVTGLQKHMD